MRRRKLVITVAAAALFGVLVVPASAELHRVTVTLSRARRSRSPSTSRPARRSSRSRSRACPRPCSRSSTSAPSRPRRPPPPPRADRARADRDPVPDAPTPVADRAPGGRTTTPPRAGTRAGGKRGGKQGATQQPNQLDPNAEALTGKLEEQAEDARAAGRRDQPDPQHGRLADARQPDRLAGRAGRRPHRRPELLHREVPHPAVPAPDLPGRRHRVRRALGGPGRDQRDRDRLRPQPQRLLRRRARLDAVHALDVGRLRRRRQPGRPEGPVQPGRRDLRRRALPPRRRRRHRPARARSSPTTTPTGTSTPSSCARATSAACRPTSSARSPA